MKTAAAVLAWTAAAVVAVTTAAANNNSNIKQQQNWPELRCHCWIHQQFVSHQKDFWLVRKSWWCYFHSDTCLPQHSCPRCDHLKYRPGGQNQTSWWCCYHLNKCFSQYSCARFDHLKYTPLSSKIQTSWRCCCFLYRCMSSTCSLHAKDATTWTANQLMMLPLTHTSITAFHMPKIRPTEKQTSWWCGCYLHTFSNAFMSKIPPSEIQTRW